MFVDGVKVIGCRREFRLDMHCATRTISNFFKLHYFLNCLNFWVTEAFLSGVKRHLRAIFASSPVFQKKKRFCRCRLTHWHFHWSSRASSDTVSFTFTYHTWQFIIFTTFTLTACILSYSFSILFCTQESRLGSSANSFLHRSLLFLPDWFHGFSDHLTVLFCSTAGFVCMMC